MWCPLEVTGIYAADTMNQMPMAMMLMPCVVSCSGGTRYPCHVWCLFSRHHEPDTHAHDTDTMSGILDAHAADAVCGILWRCPTCNYCNLLHRGSCRNQIPMAMIPIEPMPIPYPCSRYRCRVWHLLEVTGIYAADNHEPDAYATDAVCGIFWR